ncbi:MAG TPA: porin [Pseudomonadales bacterium]|nr:porin [Pseudomonadales bacterium]
MKFKLLPLAIGAAVAAQAGAVMADASVYGKINLSAQQVSFDYLGSDKDAITGLETKSTSKDASQYLLNTNTSRLGVKGKNKLSDDLDAVYKMEFEVVADTGDAGSASNSSPFKTRNIVGGLSSKTWGTIQAGKNDTVLKMLADGTDQFNDLLIGDITHYMVGENRQSNILMYTSPTWSGFTLGFTDELSEDSGVSTGATSNDETGFLERYSLSGKYAFNDTSFIGLAADHNIKNADIVRLVGAATFGDFTFDAHIQQASVSNNDLSDNGIKGELGEGIGGSTGLENALGNALGASDAGALAFYKDIKEQDAWMVNGKYQMGDWAFKAQYGQSTSESAINASGPAFAAKHTFDAKQIALGVDYSLSKNTIVYGYGAKLTVDTDKVNLWAGNAGSNDNADLKTIGVGFETKF